MSMGTSTQAYGEPWYWDNRYANESGPFDWYQKYPSLAPLIRHCIPLHHHRVLVVGCGNSTFSVGMVDDGYEDVVNIDISSVVIEAMQKKYPNRPQLKYIRMDARDMSSFQTGSFHAVVDKGTLDSILCGNNSRQNAKQMLDEVWRVLKDKGVYILITYGSPTYRLSLLRESCLWRVKLHVIDWLFTLHSLSFMHSVIASQYFLINLLQKSTLNSQLGNLLTLFHWKMEAHWKKYLESTAMSITFMFVRRMIL
ncbi:EEF1A lysine methyltransferase 4 isoform X2 [Tripterygium wilfordii]|uniref:EEF1A lysine methyltransferase 4 isoform X2 n=1 Tax=Tripterygium wilfordii TaxID=458696 RepID=UPI0018F82CAF|nr:EEF1A lysine methyltransferase 4 isoform X2 [Tripterygium wilfordii]